MCVCVRVGVTFLNSVGEREAFTFVPDQFGRPRDLAVWVGVI